MYLDHYQLNAKPFDLSPGPRFLWLGEKHKEALATLNYGIMEDLGFLLLTGDVGVGKTALIHRLIENLDPSTIVAHITDPGLGTIDFFKLLAVEFNIPVEFHGKGEFLIELEKFLYAAYADHKKVLLIVDESQRLNNKLLDQIRVLSNIELSDRKLINIFFVGQPEFKKMLMADSNRAIRQRLAINYHIQPLTESETRQYIEHRLEVAGATRQIFKPNAIGEIFRFTGGFPRSINVICDHALVTGYASGLNSIDSAVIEECENELSIRAGVDFRWTDFKKPAAKKQPETHQASPRRSKSMVAPVLIGILAVLSALAGYYLLWPTPRGTMTTTDQNTMSDAFNSQADSVVKPQNQAILKNEIASADRPPANDTAPVRSSPDPLPDKGTEDSGAIITGKTDNTLASRSAPSNAESKIQPPKVTPSAETDPLPYSNTGNSSENGADKTGTDAAVFADLAANNSQSEADPIPQNETAAQKVPPARAVEPVADDQTEVPSVVDAPKAESSADTPSNQSPVTASGKAAAAMVAALTASKPEPIADPLPAEDSVAQETPPARKADEVVDDQAAPPAANADPSTSNTMGVESDTTTSDKTGAEAAAVAVLAAKPDPVADPVPQKETVSQMTPPARRADAVLDDQAAVPAAKPSPKAEPTATTPVVNKDASKPGKTATSAAAVTVLAAAEPSSPSIPATSVGSAGTQPTTSRPEPVNTQNPGLVESKSQATVSPSEAAEEQTATAEKKPSDSRLETSLAATTEEPLQSSSQVGESASDSKGQLDGNVMENRLRSFLETYCNTYAAKDLDRFTNFFATSALENGKPFDSLVPKYERNFKFIETIQYRIELQDFSIAEDKQIIKIGGDFFLKWLPPDKKWRENSGKIYMSLIDNGSSFLVQRLDYQGGSSKEN